MEYPYSRDYLEDVLVRFAYHSTGIEGNTLSLNDTRLILQFGQVPSSAGHSLREVYEVDKHLTIYFKKRVISDHLVRFWSAIFINY